jgi:hypothetical protein
LNVIVGLLAALTGSAPWTNQPVSFQLPGQLGQYYKLPERWAAYIDAATGFGVGVYNPYATDLVAYRIGPDNSNAKSDCSYFAPLVTAAIQPDTDFTYDVYITVGRVDDMRKRFKAIAATVQPNLALQRRIPLEVDGGLQGSPSRASFAQRHRSSPVTVPPVQEELAQYSSTETDAAAGEEWGDEHAQSSEPVDNHNKQPAERFNKDLTEDADREFQQSDNDLFLISHEQILSAADQSIDKPRWLSTPVMPTRAAMKQFQTSVASLLAAAARWGKELLRASVPLYDPSLSTD